MTTLAQLVSDVITITNRPDLVDEINLAVRQATQFFHLKDFWKRDSEERLFQFTDATFLFSLSITNTLERFRKIRYIKKFDMTAGLPKETEFDKFTECDPDSLFDRYSAIKTNIFYLGGDSLNIRSSTPETALLVSWYRYPNTSQEAFSSWIADMYSSAIVNKASALVFNNIGMTEESNKKDKMALEIDLPVIMAQDIEVTAR